MKEGGGSSTGKVLGWTGNAHGAVAPAQSSSPAVYVAREYRKRAAANALYHVVSSSCVSILCHLFSESCPRSSNKLLSLDPPLL
jgi:ribulose kinase